MTDQPPGIIDVTYIDHYNLLITFTNSEQRIFDASYSMSASPRALLYQPIHKFKEFRYDEGKIFWGNEEDDTDHQIFHDSLWWGSIPFVAMVSAGGKPHHSTLTGYGTFQNFPFVLVRDMPPFPIDCIKYSVFAYVHAKDANCHEEPHVHINLEKTVFPFKMDGTPILNVPNVPYTGKILKNIKKWILDNIYLISEAWNKENPDCLIDPY